MATGQRLTIKPESISDEMKGPKGGPKWRIIAVDKKTYDTTNPECRTKVLAAIDADGTVELYVTPSSDPDKYPPWADLPRESKKSTYTGGGARGPSPEQINAENGRVSLQEARAVVVATLPPGTTPDAAVDLVLAAAQRFAAFIGTVAVAPVAAPTPNQPTSSPAPKGAARGPVGKPSPKGTDGAATGAADDPGPAGNGEAEGKTGSAGAGKEGRLTPDRIQKILKQGAAKGLDEAAILKFGRENLKISRPSLAECTVEEGRQLYEAIKAALPVAAGAGK